MYGAGRSSGIVFKNVEVVLTPQAPYTLAATEQPPEMSCPSTYQLLYPARHDNAGGV